MRPYRELLSDDPAWPEIAAQAAASTRATTILPRDAAKAADCLERLQVTTRSALGAIAHETGGVLVDHGWLRVLGSGHARLPRQLGEWNEQLGVPVSDFLIVADDVLGGVFAIDGDALGAVRGNVHYFAPDTLDWEDTELGYGAFVQWAFTGDLDKFYEDVRWPSWRDDVDKLDGDHALHIYPPLWTPEGKAISTTSRRPIPVAELWRFNMDIRARLGRR